MFLLAALNSDDFIPIFYSIAFYSIFLIMHFRTLFFHDRTLNQLDVKKRIVIYFSLFLAISKENTAFWINSEHILKRKVQISKTLHIQTLINRTVA